MGTQSFAVGLLLVIFMQYGQAAQPRPGDQKNLLIRSVELVLATDANGRRLIQNPGLSRGQGLSKSTEVNDFSYEYREGMGWAQVATSIGKEASKLMFRQVAPGSWEVHDGDYQAHFSVRVEEIYSQNKLVRLIIPSRDLNAGFAAAFKELAELVQRGAGGKQPQVRSVQYVGDTICEVMEQKVICKQELEALFTTN